MNRSLVLALTFLTFLAGLGGLPAAGADEPTRGLGVVGPSSHPPVTHEVAAGGRLMKHCLEHMQNVPGVTAQVVKAWPSDEQVLQGVDSLVFIGDTFPAGRFEDSDVILKQIDQMMARGCGIVCVHYATGLLGQDVSEAGEHPLLHWLGGYFANRSCPHHESFARIFPESTIEPAAPQHPICRGWQAFTVHDEPYYNNYFGKQGVTARQRVTVLATSQLPPDAPQTEPVAWCIEREDTGRGFAIVMPHFYKNWGEQDLRRCILNGIVWTAKRDIPAAGIQTELPALTTFQPERPKR
jgi:type 1 glutamine amidotransferase